MFKHFFTIAAVKIPKEAQIRKMGAAKITDHTHAVERTKKTAVTSDQRFKGNRMDGGATLSEPVLLCVCVCVLGIPHLMQAPFFYLIYTVDHKRGDHGCAARDVVGQHALHTRDGGSGHFCDGGRGEKALAPANGFTHLSRFDRRGNGVGDAGQRATLPALGVRHHPAVPTLERDLAELDPLSAGDAGLGLDHLRREVGRCSTARGERRFRREGPRGFTVLETNSCCLAPPRDCGVPGCTLASAAGWPGCLKRSTDWTDSESSSAAAAETPAFSGQDSSPNHPPSAGPSRKEYLTRFSPAASPVGEGLDGGDGFDRSSAHGDAQGGLCHQRLVPLRQTKSEHTHTHTRAFSPAAPASVARRVVTA